MTKQRNKFWSFLFSLAPGCGQMFMGFMKRGLSLLLLFAGSIAVASLFGIGELGFLSVVIWCWAFFDSLNLMSLTPEKFATIEDDFVILGKNSEFPQSKISPQKLSRAAGVALILIGVLSIWNSVFSYFYNSLFYYNEYIAELVYRLNYYLPRILISLFVIWIGAKLIRRKKIETKDEVPFDDSENK